MKDPFDLSSVFHELHRFEHLCALPLEVAYFPCDWGSDALETKAAFESNVNWQVSVFARFRDLQESLKDWTPEIVITHDHVEERGAFAEVDESDDPFGSLWGDAKRHKPRLWARTLRQDRSRARNFLIPFIVGQVSHDGYDGPVPRHSFRSGLVGGQKPIEVNDAYDMVIYGHGSLEDTPWIIANKMWSFLNKVEGVKSAQSDRDDIGSRIRIVSSFIRQQVERGSQRDRDCRHVSPTLDFFSRSAETWCIQHAGKSIGGRNWSKLRMLGACFDESCLHHCDFHGCRLVAATFKGAKLEGVNFDNAVMDGIAMEQARLVNCSFAGTRLREANLDGADLRGSSLSNVDLNQASLIGANLAGAKLTKTPLSSAKMQRCNMAESRCDGLRAYHADFRQADLAGASLTKAELYGGKFDGANLARCDLSGAEVENCCFLGVSGLTTSQVRSTQGWEFALFDEELLKELGLAEATAVELNNPAFRKKIGLEAHKPKLGEQMINYQMRMNSVRKAHGLQSVVVSEKTIWPSLLDFSGRD